MIRTRNDPHALTDEQPRYGEARVVRASVGEDADSDPAGMPRPFDHAAHAPLVEPRARIREIRAPAACRRSYPVTASAGESPPGAADDGGEPH